MKDTELYGRLLGLRSPWFVRQVCYEDHPERIAVYVDHAAGMEMPCPVCGRYDGAKGFRFISYAVWWIKQAIFQAIAEHARTVRLPVNKLDLLKNIAKVSHRLGQGREREPDVEEVAAELEVPAEEILDAMLSARMVLSLDEAFAGEGNLYDILADTRLDAPDAEVMRHAIREQLESVLNSLDEHELTIIRLYFGLDDTEALTMEQIGGLFKLTRERVRQLKEQALAKLRHPTRASPLLELMGDVNVQFAHKVG